MCDCYTMKCRCKKHWVPIHIADFEFPRKIIKHAYCPKCSIKYFPSYSGYIFIDGKAKQKWDKGILYFVPVGVNNFFVGRKEGVGFFALEYDVTHKDFLHAAYYWGKGVYFNGNPFENYKG